jgi:hypothetical protein
MIKLFKKVRQNAPVENLSTQQVGKTGEYLKYQAQNYLRAAITKKATSIDQVNLIKSRAEEHINLISKELEK